MLKNGACCYYYSGGHPGWRLKCASSSFLKIFAVGAVTMSAGRSFHILTTLWLNVNLRRSSLGRSFFSFKECPRSLEVSAICKTSRHWMPTRDTWRIFYTSIMSPLFILQDNEYRFSIWAIFSYPVSLRHFKSFVERHWATTSSSVARLWRSIRSGRSIQFMEKWYS